MFATTLLVSDRESGRPRGFGFVTLEATAAKSACDALNNTDFMVGHQLDHVMTMLEHGPNTCDYCQQVVSAQS